VLDDFDEATGLPTTNRDQSCAFCDASRPRFAHPLDRAHVQYRLDGKGHTLPTFWTVCERCETLVRRSDDAGLLRVMSGSDEGDDTEERQSALRAFRASDLGAVRLLDAELRR
jgi:hypothetical protein